MTNQQDRLVPVEQVDRDLPTEFETWWHGDSGDKRNSRLIGYSDKKCLAYAAFEAGAALASSPTPIPVSGEVEALFREALEAIADGEGDAVVIARQTLDQPKEIAK